MRNMFSGCTSLKTIPLLDASNVTNMDYAFNSCVSLIKIPKLNTSKVKSMASVFSNCSKMTEVPQLDTNSLETANSMFSNCQSIIKIPKLDMSNAINVNSMFQSCCSLRSIPTLNTSKIINIANIFTGCYNLMDLGGFINLGQAYLQSSAENYFNYTLDLSPCINLTHDSLMNVINNLYDIKSKGCKNQALVLGATNLAKLTAEEIAVATNKGWNVS